MNSEERGKFYMRHRTIPDRTFVRGSPPKTRLGKGFMPVPSFSSDDGVSPPKPKLGMGQDRVV